MSLLLCPFCFAQNQVQSNNEYEGILHENILSIRWGGIRHYDEYLSPLLYSGQFISLQNEWWQTFRSTADWQHVGKVKLQAGRAYNPPYSNICYALGLQGGWGAHYDFQRLISINAFHLFIGPYLDIDLLGKELVQNVNKPYSIDFSIDMKAQAGISYCFSGKRSSYRIRYLAATSILGAQFVPQYWQSYYEISEGIVDGTVGFSSLHNHLTLRHELCFDMQFPHSAWRLGVEHEYIRHNMNNLHFQREQVCLIVGTVFNYSTKIRKMQ